MGVHPGEIVLLLGETLTILCKRPIFSRRDNDVVIGREDLFLNKLPSWIPTLVRSDHSHIRSSILPERHEFRGQGNLVTCHWTFLRGAILIGSYHLWGTKIGQGVRPA